MKRFLTLAVIALFVMLPLASFARTVVNDNDLDAITAESGVSIEFTNLSVGNTTTLSSISWGDTSGFTGYETPGYFGFKNVDITGNLAQIASGSLNIDVGTGASGETKVFLVLPTITLGTASISAWIMADKTANFTSASFSQGGIWTMNGFSTQVTGTVAIYAHD